MSKKLHYGRGFKVSFAASAIVATLGFAHVWAKSTGASSLTWKSGAGSSSAQVIATWVTAGSQREIKRWSLSELGQLKKTSSREKDPLSGKVFRWDGVLLSTVVDQALETLPIEDRAQIDLIVLKGAGGERALVPRAFVGKYPLLVALSRESGESDGRLPVFTVVPWTSKPRVLNEDLPLENFFVPRISQIELTNYREQYTSFYLKRRTDPSAMRGEKLFVQNCVSCHANEKNPALAGIADEFGAKRFATAGHPATQVALKLKEKDRFSILRYFNAHREENPVVANKAIHSVRAPAQK